jgi:hypothetical protein
LARSGDEGVVFVLDLTERKLGEEVVRAENLDSDVVVMKSAQDSK